MSRVKTTTAVSVSIPYVVFDRVREISAATGENFSAVLCKPWVEGTFTRPVEEEAARSGLEKIEEPSSAPNLKLLGGLMSSTDRSLEECVLELVVDEGTSTAQEIASHLVADVLAVEDVLAYAAQKRQISRRVREGTDEYEYWREG